MKEEASSVRAILDTVAEAINTANEADLTASFQFVLADDDDEGETVYRLVIVAGHAELVDGPGDATSTVYAKAADALLIFSGKFDAMKAFMEGRMRVEGDLLAMSAISAFLPGGTASSGGPVPTQHIGLLKATDSPSLEEWSDRVAERLPRSGTMRQVAEARDFFVGAAVPAPDGTEVLHREFNCLGSENAFKWSRLAKFVGQYDFALTDEFVDYAESHRMRLRGHTLIWGRGGRPQDLETVLRSSDDQAETLRRLMGEHIELVASRYRGKVHVWDVVNEPMAYSGVGLDRNVFFELLGEQYVDDSFHLARAADPDAELVINEQISASQYGGESAREFLDLVERLLDRGAPVDGVGLQGHMLMGVPDREALTSFLLRIQDLGLFIEITEMDMRIGLFAGEADPLSAQAEAYNMLAEVFASVPAVRGVMLWGVGDNVSWLDHFPPFDAGAPNQPLLLDHDLEPKPAYYAFMHGLAARQPVGADQ